MANNVVHRAAVDDQANLFSLSLSRSEDCVIRMKWLATFGSKAEAVSVALMMDKAEKALEPA